MTATIAITQEQEPLLQATAHGVGTGSTTKWQWNSNMHQTKWNNGTMR